MPFDHRGRWIPPNHRNKPYPKSDDDWNNLYPSKPEDKKGKSEGEGNSNDYPTEGPDDNDSPEGWDK
jgi:hypothetical protein